MILLLNEMVIILSLSCIVLLVCHRFRIPGTVGFLLTGLLCGPYGLALVKSVEQVSTLSEVGIILLLFTVGLEFSLEKIFLFKKFFLAGGALQVCLTTIIVDLIGLLMGKPVGEALFIGFLLSMSSTAIVFRLQSDQKKGATPTSNLSAGILVFQDICAVLMMLVIPSLAAYDRGSLSLSLDTALFSTAVAVGSLSLILFAGNRLIPVLFYAIAKTKNRELFLLATLTLCLSVAWFASMIGLSLALGAFLAGLVISDSEYKHEAISDVLPFQELFTSLFFVSVGMLFNTAYFFAHPLLITALTTGVILLKALVVVITTLLIGMTLEVGFAAALTLCQVGEFSFVLARVGISHGIGSEESYQLFLAVTLLSMSIAPFLIHAIPKIVPWLLSLFFPAWLRKNSQATQSSVQPPLEDHVIIVGFGISGKVIARGAKQANIPYTILEMNPDTVRFQKKKGEPISFGDATHETILRHAGLATARAVVILANEASITLRIIARIKKLAPNVHIIARTRYQAEVPSLYAIGADDVVSDEFGSAIELLNSTLMLFGASEEIIEEMTAAARTNEGEPLFSSYFLKKRSVHAERPTASSRSE